MLLDERAGGKVAALLCRRPVIFLRRIGFCSSRAILTMPCRRFVPHSFTQRGLPRAGRLKRSRHGRSQTMEGEFKRMSTPNDPHDPIHQAEPVDDLMIPDDEEPQRDRVSSSVRDIASRIPESLSSIGRDISRTIERAISAKDD